MPGLEFSLVWLPWATKPLCPSCALPLTLHPNVCPSHPQLPFDFFLKQGDGLIHPYNSQRSWSTNAACQAWGKDDSTYELAMAFFTFLLFSFSRVRPTRVVVDTWEAILFDRVPLCSAVKAPGGAGSFAVHGRPPECMSPVHLPMSCWTSTLWNAYL